MHAMQYTVSLPADYDMEIIRKRVRDKGRLTDDFPGLGLKAYLVRERGTDGSPVNAYAPFYLWNDTEGLGRFLWGGAAFSGIVTDFGRPTVRHWIGATAAAGPDRDSAPSSATLSRYRVPDGADPAGAMARAEADVARQALLPGVHSTALALDPHHWELVRFTLWVGAAPQGEPGDRYQVLHLSAPGLDTLTGAARPRTG